MNSPSAFDFDFGGDSRLAFLEEAQKNLIGLGAELSEGGRENTGGEDAASKAASDLLVQLGQELAEFTAYPEVLPLEKKHFTEHGLAVPPRFSDLTQNFRFYWIRIPLTLWPQEGLPFTKLECALAFNPGTTQGHLRPVSQMILPDKQFAQQLALTGSLNLTIGQTFEFEAATGKADLQTGPQGSKLKAGAEVKVSEAGNLGLIVGPFMYRLKKALIDHSPPGTEKVFWRLSDARFLREDTPDFIVVLRVPHAVNKVEVTAGLQAYHQENLLARFLSYLSLRAAAFFRKGAPTSDSKTWLIPPL
jgi:hypothetical protein